MVAVLWLAASLAGAWLSVDRKLPYDLGAIDVAGRRDQVADDWLFGWGTALAVPLAVVALMAVLAVLCTQPGGFGRVGTFVIALLGGASLAYTLGNRRTHTRLSHLAADRVEAVVVIGTLATAGLLVLLGLGSWAMARRD